MAAWAAGQAREAVQIDAQKPRPGGQLLGKGGDRMKEG